MSLARFEVGIVSADRALVDFLSDVFELEELPAGEHQVGTVHRLQSPGAVIKVMVPNETPKDANGQPFLAVKGLRYLSMYVTDLDRVIERSIARAGSVLLEPFELHPGVRLAVISDLDGNAMEVTEAP